MRRKGKLFLSTILLLNVVLLFSYSCGDINTPSSTATTGDSSGGAPPASDPASITLAANPSTLAIQSTSTITAAVLDSSGNSVSDGTVVTFSLNDSSLGTIDSQSTTTNGNTTVTFTAGATAGTVVVTAAVNNISNTVSITIQVSPASVNLTANPNSITIQGTSTITATILDSLGNSVPDGTVVTFSLNDSSLGSIASQSTTSNGDAVATFSASTNPGTAVISATADTVSNTVSITIQAAAVGSIEFGSASPQVIGIQGSGQIETSTITFMVNDENGNPVEGAQVTFTMNALGGGEYINPSTASTVAGVASTFLHSGTVAGPVTIIASVDVNGNIISSSSTPVSIGGGVPSARHLTITTDVFNLPGISYANRQAIISVYAADRFGNYNILNGTSVSFYAEAGAIDRNANLDDKGTASVTFRTQNPVPADVAPNAFETSLINDTYDAYGNPYPTWWGINSTSHPRDGWDSILVTAMGEEAFIDANGNGIYDSGETFTDISDEPFIDKNNNDSWDDGTSDPFEEYIDVNGNGQYDGPNGCWDGPNPDPGYTCTGRQDSKMIFQTMTLMFTGGPTNFAALPFTSVDKVDPTKFDIADGGIADFFVIIGDINLNTLSPGTTITISADGGKLSASPPSPIGDGIYLQPTIFEFSLADKNTGDTNAPEPVIVTIDVTWEGIKSSIMVKGKID